MLLHSPIIHINFFLIHLMLVSSSFAPIEESATQPRSCSTRTKRNPFTCSICGVVGRLQNCPDFFLHLTTRKLPRFILYIKHITHFFYFSLHSLSSKRISSLSES
ncbi:hypothetical protein GEMRC1_005396 [Eukaryota sp. GEM-RC1]